MVRVAPEACDAEALGRPTLFVLAFGRPGFFVTFLLPFGRPVFFVTFLLPFGRPGFLFVLPFGRPGFFFLGCAIIFPFN
jgi:hypothetical protein